MTQSRPEPKVIVIPAKEESPQDQEKKKNLRVAAYCRVSTKKDEQLKTALDAVSKYHEYRAQSIRIQKELQTEIEALRSAQNEQTSRLKKMEDDTTRRERNRLRDRLLQSYRYYTDPSCNPTGAWNTMEAEALWEMISDYEDVGGDGYIHSVVQPAMNLLKIVDIGEHIPGRTYPGSKHSES